MALGLMLVIYLQGKRENLPLEGRSSFHQITTSFFRAFLALLIPVIILGGIKIGAFTATEGAAIAVIYAAIISMIVY